ncbi:cytochrome P450 [Saccharothrix syringae]|uniref:Cytochrome P450 n=1 Tax=Saccharothrix syringae TaxID=103733 RepID=A0A5Q0H5M4_SACSY|nr:cytochrome P450 [Saccharothrix syringae]QFZ21140.1 cytochrome P450 [Saccharothrix syringae]
MTVQLPFTQEDPLRFPPALSELIGSGSVHRIRTVVGDEGWLVTDYNLVRTLLSDDRLGRAHPAPETAARAGASALFGGPMGDFDTERTDHARLRRLLQPHFTPGRMRALRPRVEAITEQLIDEMARRTPPVDLNDALALPLPILVICELIGVPYADRADFRAWSEAAGDIRDGARSLEGLGKLYEYGRQLIASKHREPGDDVLSRLCQDEDVSDEEAAVLSMSLLFAGHETTVVQIGMGALGLLANPDQWRALRDDPDLVPNAVDEIMRIPGTSGGGVPRYARTDLEIDGVAVKTGDLVLLDIGAANHDPEVFPDPNRVDVTRRAAHHLSFGHGSHYCIGAPLARIELQAVFSRLPVRFPDMRPAVPLEELTMRQDALTGGLTSLPVTW